MAVEFLKLTGTSRRHRRHHTARDQRRRFRVEALEYRRLLASVSLDPISQILTVDARDDVVGAQISVVVNGAGTLTAQAGDESLSTSVVPLRGVSVFGSSHDDTIFIIDQRLEPNRELARFEIDASTGDDAVLLSGPLGVGGRVVGGEGNDTVDASQLATGLTIEGGAGNDRLTAGDGDDTIDGGLGHDRIAAGGGQNTIRELVGTDYIPNDSEVLLSFVVSNTNDSGIGSLRQAIADANDADATSVIEFQIVTAGNEAATIQPESALPPLSNPNHPVIINGRTQSLFEADGSGDAPRIVVDGRRAGEGVDGITSTTDRNRIHHLNFQQFDGHGIAVTGGSAAVVADNYVGTDTSGTIARGNQVGIFVSAPDTQILNNVVSGNRSSGLWIRGIRNTVQGNLVGAAADGASPLGNAGVGIWLLDAKNGLIGGPDAHSRNVVSANGKSGILLQRNSTSNNVIQGNYVGIAADGTTEVANGERGIYLSGGSRSNVVRENVIGGHENGFSGIGIVGGPDTANETDRNLIVGNWIGVIPFSGQGSSIVRNSTGISISGSGGNIVGGNQPEDANVIGGNTFGIYLLDPNSDGNQVLGNFIGTDALGTAGLGNGRGIVVAFGAERSVLRSNVISGNGSGIWLRGAEGREVSGTTIESNLIGVAPDGTPLANFHDGILLDNWVKNNVIGGTDSRLGNTIAYNSRSGIVVTGADSFGNSIRRNSIHSNVGIEIDLGGDGVTLSDPGDLDTGPNHLQNFGQITNVVTRAPGRVFGTFSGAENATVEIDLYANSDLDESGYGGGERFLQTLSVTTDTRGLASFSAQLEAGFDPDDVLTLTSTGADGSTSEFSQAFYTNSEGNNVREAFNDGITALRSVLPDLGSRLNLAPFDLPVVNGQLDSIFGLSGEGGLLDDIGQSSLTTIDRSVASLNGLRDQIEALSGFDVVCVNGERECGNDLIAVTFRHTAAELQASVPIGNLAAQFLQGVSDDLRIGGTLNYSADVTLALEMGVDADGFYFGPQSTVDVVLQIDGDIDASYDLPLFEWSVSSRTGSQASATLVVTSGLPNTNERMRTVDLAGIVQRINVDVTGGAEFHVNFGVDAVGDLVALDFPATWDFESFDEAPTVEVEWPSQDDIVDAVLPLLSDGTALTFRDELGGIFQSIPIPFADEFGPRPSVTNNVGFGDGVDSNYLQHAFNVYFVAEGGPGKAITEGDFVLGALELREAGRSRWRRHQSRCHR